MHTILWPLQEEDPNRNKKKPLGDANHFCPVILKESNIMYPGNPEISARYREKIYYFSTNEARDKFLASPPDFLPTSQPLEVNMQKNNIYDYFLFFWSIILDSKLTSKCSQQ